MEKCWSPSHKGRYDPIWALYASILLHALSILALSSMSNFDLTIGPEARFDILWLSPSSAPFAAPAAVIEAAALPAPAAARSLANAKEQSFEETDPDSAPQPSPPPDVEAPEAPLAWPVPATKLKEPAVAPADAEAPPGKGFEQPAAATSKAASAKPQKPPPARPETSRAGKQIKTQAVAKAEPLLVPEKEPDHGDTPITLPAPRTTLRTEKEDQRAQQFAPPKQKAEPVAVPGRPRQPSAKEAAPALRENPGPKRLAVLPKTQVIGQAPAAALSAPITPPRITRHDATPPAGTRAGKESAVNVPPKDTMPKPLAPARAAVVAKEGGKPKSAEKPPEVKGIVVASLHGDLKMVITGGSELRLSVTFRDYPSSRRNRVSTRSESRRELKIVPVFAKTRQDTREAVIETAREGIYVFSVEAEQGGAVKASFTLKIFETGAKEKVAAIGTRTVSTKAVLTKVLMPEGVVWDDDAAFTGSLEDSDSVTKFNAQTGLYWKEYND